MLPAPGEVRYLRSNPSVDEENAARRLDQGRGDPELAAAPVIPEPVQSTPVVAEAEPVEPPVEEAPARRPSSPRPSIPPHRPRTPRPQPPPIPPPRRGSRVLLLNRRVGLLFALFLTLLVAAGGRAAWLGTVKAGGLKERAFTQQVEDLDVTARRGTISDRNGLELAVSEDAVTVFANPRLVKDPAATAEKLAPLLGRPRDAVLADLSEKNTGFVYLARKLGPVRGDQGGEARDRGPRHGDGAQADLPAGPLAAQLVGSVGPTTTA